MKPMAILIVWTLLGAFIAFLLAPAKSLVRGLIDDRPYEEIFYALGGAHVGFILGIVILAICRLRKPPAS